MSEADILLIEDAEPDVFLVREALRHAGLNYNLRVSGGWRTTFEFIDQLERDNSDPNARKLVLLDLNLPKRSGDQILEHMRHSGRCSRIPVIVVTSSDSAKDRAIHGSAGGETDCFRQPSLSG